MNHRKIIGLIGASLSASEFYHHRISSVFKQRLGQSHHDDYSIYCVNCLDVEDDIKDNNWNAATNKITEAAYMLEKIGAKLIVLTSPELHKVLPTVEKVISMPVLHIAKTVAIQASQHRVKKVLLLGNKWVMKEDFLSRELVEAGLEVVASGELADNTDYLLNSVGLYDPLATAVKEQLVTSVNERIKGEGVEAILLTDWRLSKIFKPADFSVTVLDASQNHAFITAVKIIHG